MRKIVIVFMAGLLLIGVNVFAAGDLDVNGHAVVGNNVVVDAAATFGTNETTTLDDYSSSNFTMSWNPTSSTTANIASGVTGFNAVEGTNFGAGSQSIGLAFKNTSSTGAGTNGHLSNLDVYAIQAIGFGTFFANFTANSVYGIDITSVKTFADLDKAVTVNNTYGLFVHAPSVSPGESLNVNTINAGLWIEDTSTGSGLTGTRTDYGIVLDGDNEGADIVFNPSGQQTRLYSSGGRLYAHDSFDNATILSPHDPETGEWVYYSRNVKTGKTVQVNMEKLVKAVEKLTGEKFMIETMEK